MFMFSVLSYQLIAQGITIKSGTTIIGGSATITLSGSWSNSGTFTPGTSTVIFNGASGNQTIANSNGETFNKKRGKYQSGQFAGLYAINVGDIDQ